MWHLCRACLLILCLVGTGAAAELRQTATVIDGDTLDLAGTRVRLHGIDAPESAQTCRAGDRVWRCGQRAAFAIADKIGRRPVQCTERDRDRYGRIVAVCRVGDEDLGAWMAREGWALAYRRYATDYVDEEDEARRAGRGLWRGAFVPPWDWRRGTRLKTGEAPAPALIKT